MQLKAYLVVHHSVKLSGQWRRWSRFSRKKGPKELHLCKDTIWVKKVEFLWHDKRVILCLNIKAASQIIFQMKKRCSFLVMKMN